MHGTKPTDNQISSEQQRLQKNIRLHAINYLKEYSFKLTQLPSAEEYEKLKEQKQKLLIEDLDREKREQQSDLYNSSKDNSTNNAGWIPSASMSANSDNKNPIEIQIDVVKNYLIEAKKEKRIEEIKILEKNLTELSFLLNNQD